MRAHTYLVKSDAKNLEKQGQMSKCFQKSTKFVSRRKDFIRQKTSLTPYIVLLDFCTYLCRLKELTKLLTIPSVNQKLLLKILNEKRIVHRRQAD